MSIKKFNDIEESLNILRDGLCTRWGYLPDAPTKRILKIGKWEVNIQGDIVFDGYYHIQKERLSESDWVIHLMTKDWFDFNEFMPVFMQAHFNAELKSVQFNLTYNT